MHEQTLANSRTKSNIHSSYPSLSAPAKPLATTQDESQMRVHFPFEFLSRTNEPSNRKAKSQEHQDESTFRKPTPKPNSSREIEFSFPEKPNRKSNLPALCFQFNLSSLITLSILTSLFIFILDPQKYPLDPQMRLLKTRDKYDFRTYTFI